MYSYQTKVRLTHTDAAKRLYFGSIFDLAHEAFESFLDEGGLSVRHMIEEGDFIPPVVHAEADFLEPIYVGDRLDVGINCSKIGASSFTISYTLTNETGGIAATAKLVHVVILKETKKTVAIPPRLKKLLESIAG